LQLVSLCIRLKKDPKRTRDKYIVDSFEPINTAEIN